MHQLTERSSNTTGISVTYTDAGKGNVVADTTSFSGGSYSLTATLNIGGQTRTRTINGTVNINQLSAAAGAGFKTGWQPAWWKHYDVIGRAKNSCANQVALWQLMLKSNRQMRPIISLVMVQEPCSEMLMVMLIRAQAGRTI